MNQAWSETTTCSRAVISNNRLFLRRMPYTVAQLGQISTVGFVIALAGFIMPWLSVIKNWPFALIGYKIAMGQFNIPPTEYYALGIAALAAGGAVLPHVVPRRRTIQRILFAALGILLMLLMRIHLPDGLNEVEWRLGYYVTLGSLVTVLALNAAVVGGLFRRRRRRRGRRRSRRT